VAATFEKAKTYVLAGMVIHNPKVGGSIPPPATNQIILATNRRWQDSFGGLRIAESQS
jgi:hypothetical protein